MFDIVSLVTENFRCYVGRHEFKFPAAPGLYLFTGRNDLNPRLGANGTGKSTLLDAIYWCLYGRTPRGLKAGDIITWGCKTASVTVTLIVGDLLFTVKRTQSPNSLKIKTETETRTIDQLELNKLLRLTPDQFELAVMMPQFGESFFDLKPEAKLRLFTDILGLDYWIAKSGECGDLVDVIEADKTDHEHKLSTAKGAIKTLEASLAELNAKRDTYEADRLRHLKGLQKQISEIDAERPGVEKLLGTARKGLTTAKVKLKQFDTKREELREEVSVLIAKRAALEQEIKGLEGSRHDLKGVGVKCPVCRQRVDKAHIRDELERIGDVISDRKAKMPDDAIARLQDQIRDHSKSMVTVAQNHDDFQREVRKLENQLGDLDARWQALRVQLGHEKESGNPFDATIAQQGQKLTKLRLERRELTRKIDQLSNEVTAAQFWSSGFKRVRLYLIESTLQDLEIEVNNNLSALGLADWKIEFDVERENKSGGITKGFTVMVYPPDQKQPVAFAAYSGGESQRLRLAGDLGLANLIMERAGLANTIEIYDEPSRHLSQTGLQDLAETLADRAAETGRRILLVDHNTLDFGGFAGTLTVVKNSQGSHIE